MKHVVRDVEDVEALKHPRRPPQNSDNTYVYPHIKSTAQPSSSDPSSAMGSNFIQTPVGMPITRLVIPYPQHAPGGFYGQMQNFHPSRPRYRGRGYDRSSSFF